MGRNIIYYILYIVYYILYIVLLHKTGHLPKKWAPLSETRQLQSELIQYIVQLCQKSQIFRKFRTKPRIFTEIWRFRNFLKWQIFRKIGASGFCLNREIFPKIGASGRRLNRDLWQNHLSMCTDWRHVHCSC